MFIIISIIIRLLLPFFLIYQVIVLILRKYHLFYSREMENISLSFFVFYHYIILLLSMHQPKITKLFYQLDVTIYIMFLTLYKPI